MKRRAADDNREPTSRPAAAAAAVAAARGRASQAARAAPLLALGLLTAGLTSACHEPLPRARARPALKGLAAVHQRELPTDVKVKITPERVATGEAVFRQHCASCHGAQGVGRVGIGPRLNSESFLSAASDHMLLTTIGKGRMGTTMAGFGQRISKKEQESVVAYIRSLTAHEPAELDERPLHGDIGRGGELFKSICSKCHGREGAGYIESSSGTGIRRKAFISSVSDGYLRYMVKNGKSQTKMRGFDSNAPTSVANLSDDQIEDVVTYLRKAAW